MPGLGRAAGWGDGQCVLVGACDRDVLKAHPFLRERVLALIEALFGAEEQGGLKRNGVRRKRAEVTRLFLGEQGWPTLFTEKEAGYFSSLAPDTVALETTLFFSAKESFYKCQYPLTKEWVGFQDVAITRTDQHALAIAPTRGAAQAWHAAPIHTVKISASHVATVMLLHA